MPLPTFIIAGAPKAGTTALWGLLDEHPDVHLSEIKEPRFFTRAVTFGDGVVRPGPPRSIHYDRGMAWYLSLFETDRHVRGEASTIYFAAPDAPELISQHVPDVRLVFLLRDPVARLYSHYWQDVKTGIELPPFETLVSEERSELRYYARFSEYRANLQRFFATFPREHVRVLLYDDLRRDPVRTVRDVCGFIGANPAFEPSAVEHEFNPHAVPRLRPLATMAVALQNSRLADRLPSGVRRRLGRVRGQITRLNSRRAAYPALRPDLRDRLVGRFADDVAFVENLLSVDLPEWKR